jgi:hypothetical protein
MTVQKTDIQKVMNTKTGAQENENVQASLSLLKLITKDVRSFQQDPEPNAATPKTPH